MPSISERLNPSFKMVLRQTNAEDATLYLSGPLETQDELDALTSALVIMRDWLTPAALNNERERLVALIERYSLPTQRAAQKDTPHD